MNFASWFASSLVIGQVLGSLLGGGLANRIGRKKTCVLAAVGSSLGWVVISARIFLKEPLLAFDILNIFITLLGIVFIIRSVQY